MLIDIKNLAKDKLPDKIDSLNQFKSYLDMICLDNKIIIDSYYIEGNNYISILKLTSFKHGVYKLKLRCIRSSMTLDVIPIQEGGNN